MRIALLAHTHHPIAEPFAGGLEAHTALVGRELSRRGHEVTMFAKGGSRTSGRMWPVVAEGFRRRSAADDPTIDAGVHRAAAAIGRGDFDAVLNNSLNPVPWEHLDQHPMLTVLHTPATLDRVNEVVGRPGWRPGRRHAFAAVSVTTRNDWRTVLDPVPVGCIPNGIDLDHWAPTPQATVERGLAVWAARITPEKGLPVAIAAVREAGLRLEFSGPIADPKHFHAEVVPLLGPDVRYVGHLDHSDLPALLRRGSVFVASPAWPEPFGLSLVEAMACGTPVATLPRGAAREIVSPTGGVVAAGCSVSELAAAITAAGRLDRRQVRASVRRFDQHLMISAYEQALAELVGLRPARRTRSHQTFEKEIRRCR